MERVNLVLELAVKIGDFTGKIYKNKEGYFTYKVKYDKTTVATSYVYLKDKDVCYNKMVADINMLMGIDKDLFTLL